MPLGKPHITAKIAGRSLYPLLRPYAVGYFFATLACDLLYFSTQSRDERPFTVVEFALIAEWLLAAGLLIAVFAGIAALIDFYGERRFRELADLGLYIGGNILVVVLGLYNFCIRFSDGGENVMETGLILSLSAVIVLFCIPSQGWNRMYR
jgi:uncharacterized membrane protein